MELPEEFVAALKSLRALAKKAAKKAVGDDEEGGRKLRALRQLAAWLQLYLLADPESAEPELAAELLNIYQTLFGKKGVFLYVYSMPQALRSTLNGNRVWTEG